MPIAGKHIAAFRAALDVVAKERRYLLFLEAPPLAETRTYIRRQMKRGCPQYLALVAGRVVGWCDVLRGDRVTT
ncbi:MAG: GNAT family N-acetyltransferase, partial [Burkholderiales bacterium]